MLRVSGTSAGEPGRHSGIHTSPGSTRVKPSNRAAISSRVRTRKFAATRLVYTAVALSAVSGLTSRQA